MKLLLHTIIIILITVVFFGCGREYKIKGRVVVVDDNSKEQIIEVTGEQIPDNGVPVADAKVRMIHELDDQGKPVSGTTWQRETITNIDGLFEIEDYATPGEKNLVGLEISKKGFKTVYTTYWDYINKEQVFFVILEKE